MTAHSHNFRPVVAYLLRQAEHNLFQKNQNLTLIRVTIFKGAGFIDQVAVAQFAGYKFADEAKYQRTKLPH